MILKSSSLKTGVISKINVSDFFNPEIELVKSNNPNTLISLSPKSYTVNLLGGRDGYFVCALPYQIAIKEGLKLRPGTVVIPFSAETKQGREEIWELMDSYVLGETEVE